MEEERVRSGVDREVAMGVSGADESLVLQVSPPALHSSLNNRMGLILLLVLQSGVQISRASI